MLRFLMLAVVLSAVVGGGVYYRQNYMRDSHEQAFRTDKVTRGDLHIVVGATGTLEPEEVVDAGAQVVGRIVAFGKDPRGKADPKCADKNIDYGAPVEKDMVVAQLDP